jgi:diguanylate cyclase (GGDEF)-like protein/PAS domain S-box-containing protein
MKTEAKSKAQLIKEITALRRHISSLEKSMQKKNRQAEKAESQIRFLHNVINAIDDPVFVKDGKHRWVIMNDRLCDLHGRPRDYFIGRSDYDVLPKEQADVFWEKDDLVLKTGKPNLNEEEVTWGNKVHIIATKKSLLRDPDSKRKYVVGTIRDVTKLKEMERERERYIQMLKRSLAKIEKMSKTDFLTNLLNRRATLELARREMTKTIEIKNKSRPLQARKNSVMGTFSCAMLDIDFFKKVNDTHGHLVGDRVLKRIGKILSDQNIIRETDIVGRFGGEEFFVLFPETKSQNALLPLAKIKENIQSVTFSGKGGKKFHVKVSLGVSQNKNKDKSIDDVIKRADDALYFAKMNGRDQIVVYEQQFGNKS